MIYLDNAATSRFKPKSVFDILNYDIINSANSGRSGHTAAMDAEMRIENCRNYLLNKLGADDDYDLVFTKNCTEALNMAIFGYIKGGEKVVTSYNEHNSVLRPLFELERQGKISLLVLRPESNGKVDVNILAEKAKDADFIVLGGACNVTGSTLDAATVGKIAKQNNSIFLLDGAQSVPILPLHLKNDSIDMLACPAHKGLHGIQGCGFLAVRKGIGLKPMLYGGTGTYSSSVYPPIEFPDSYEAGTLFSGGISALHQGAKWSYDNLEKTRKNFDRLSSTLIYNLKSINAAVYTNETTCGVISFNIGDTDSTFIAQQLNDYNIAVRAGIHCAPLVHEFLGTSNQGAVRVSLGCDTTDKEISYFSSVIERIAKSIYR